MKRPTDNTASRIFILSGARLFVFSALLFVFNVSSSLASVTMLNCIGKGISRTEIPSFFSMGTEYIEAVKFAEVLGIKSYTNSQQVVVILSPGKNRIKLSGDNHFVTANGKVYNLLHQVVKKDDNLYLPVEDFLRNFGAMFTFSMLFFNNELICFERDINIVKMYLRSDGINSVVSILTTSGMEYSHSISGSSVKLTIPGGKVSRLITDSSHSPAGITVSTAHNYSGDLEFTIKADGEGEIKSVQNFPGGGGIDIEIQGSGLNSEMIMEEIVEAKQRWKFDTIVIDPGHGGKDPGAIGARGTYEKNIVLGIAIRLRRLIESKTGLKCVMTRDKDVFVPLYERGRIANKSGGKLFISIHCNAVKNRRVNGFEVFFLSPARNDQAMGVAMLENAAIEYEEDQARYDEFTDENYILLAMTQSNNVRLSEKLGVEVLKSFDAKTKLRNRGIDQAGFYVLYGANMPAILVETAFITNRREENLLRTKKFRQSAAEAIYQSIIKFCQQAEEENH